MADNKKSLGDLYPGRYEVPILIATSCVLLGIGLSLPLINVEKLVFWKNEYSVFTGVVNLAKQGEYLLAAVLFFFSMVFPIAKLASLWFLWAIQLSAGKRKTVLHWLGVLGKWSMLDVFVVAILIVAVKMKPMATIQPRVGVYMFGLAILLSMITTAYIERLARRSGTK